MVGTVAAVDLGASSGRLMLGRIGANRLQLEEVHRFANIPIETGDGLHWDVLDLYRSMLEGLSHALRRDDSVASVGIDSWAVDYGLFRAGRLLGNPYHYRDERTGPGVDSTHGRIPFDELYAINGLQFLPFNTLYQLAVEQADGMLDLADSLLLIPDLFNYWLTGERIAEQTNASTTGLLNIHTKQWDEELLGWLGLPRHIFAEVTTPGTQIGTLREKQASAIGAPGRLQVVTVGSHDTASAVAAVPMTGEGSAYISCGTWGLVGVELERPVLSDAAREANFTNEGGIDGTTRFLHNVMGLWLLSESVRCWENAGDHVDVPELLRQAASIVTPVPVFDVNDPRFLLPGDIPARITAYCAERGIRPPANRQEMVRSILESLSAAFSDAIVAAARLSGTTVRTVHIVGGGSQNTLLCQLVADTTGLPVLAGPAEATAIGNVLIQGRAQGFVHGDLNSLRALVSSNLPPRRYDPALNRTGN